MIFRPIWLRNNNTVAQFQLIKLHNLIINLVLLLLDSKPTCNKFSSTKDENSNTKLKLVMPHSTTLPTINHHNNPITTIITTTITTNHPNNLINHEETSKIRMEVRYLWLVSDSNFRHLKKSVFSRQNCKLCQKHFVFKTSSMYLKNKFIHVLILQSWKC